MSDTQHIAGEDEHTVRDLTPKEWNEFVADMAAGHIITSNDIDPGAWQMVFMPLAFGAFKDWTEEELGQVGVLWERLSAAGPRSVNGYPMFMSLRMLSKADWERAVPEINRRRAILRGEDPGTSETDEA